MSEVKYRVMLSHRSYRVSAMGNSPTGLNRWIEIWKLQVKRWFGWSTLMTYQTAKEAKAALEELSPIQEKRQSDGTNQ